MKYFVSASVNVRKYVEEHIEASSEAEVKEILKKLAHRGRLKWEHVKWLWSSLEVFADGGAL